MSAIPPDPALPTLPLLLDADRMASPLTRSLAREARLDRVWVARVAYKPGDRLIVHYQAVVNGKPEDAVARTVAGRDLAARARSPRYRELAGRIDGRSPAAYPVTHDPETNALLSWLPFDPGLPALAQQPHELADQLGRAGLTIDAEAHEPTIVAESYKPSSRIVLRLGDHVLKAYGKDRHYERGEAALRAAAATGLRTAAREASFPELRLTVQTALHGAVRTPLAAAAPAGELARRLQCAGVQPPCAFGPAALLAAVSEQAALAGRIVPELRGRIDVLLERLRERTPPEGPLVPAHGDFDAEQLIEDESGSFAVIDFDRLCQAPPALDLATYLADVVCGQEGDLEAVQAVRAPLLAGYDGCPPALEWQLAAVILGRSAHPFQRFVAGWPARVDGMVAAAEAVLAG